MSESQVASDDVGAPNAGGTGSGVCTVYAFMSVQHGFETPMLAPFKAARESITRRYSGIVLEGTAQSVGLAELDDQGRYMRHPTGWGELV